MKVIRRRLLCWTWLALVAVLGAALAPTVSHALTAASADHPWAEVCSSSPGSAKRPAGEIPGQGHAEHCALCVQLGAAPLPAPIVLPSAQRFARVHASEPAAPFARSAWRAAQPRGPPAAA